MPNPSLFASSFKFSQTDGVLKVKEKQKINMTFISNRLGEFNEVFKWVLKDTNEYISLNFKGNVISPTFDFDVTGLNFGLVSFNFEYSKMIKITNTSKVPFSFRLRVPGDESG